jgi:APA family basic amino acid/polyamine antiporter
MKPNADPTSAMAAQSVPDGGVPATEHRRDVGLVRAVGPVALAASIINIIVGAGIFAVPAALAACIGSWAPLAFVICAIAIGSVAICFAEGGSRIPTSGGPYGYIEAAFGPLVGYTAGTVLWFSDALACGGVAAALASVAVSALPPAIRTAAHAAVIVGVIGAIAMINLGGVARGARLVNAATLLKLIPLGIFVIAGAGAVRGANFLTAMPPTTGGLGRALILALFAFTGMEAALGASGEVVRPARTIPAALAIAMLVVTLLYISVQIVAQGVLGASLAQSTVPLADAMARINPTLSALMLAGAALSMFGWIGSDLLGTPRILFAFARDGLLPRILGRLHPRSHVPHVAILCYASLASGFALTGTFAELAVLSTLGAAALYIAGCAAAWRLAHLGVARAGEPLNFRWLRAAALTGIAGMLVLIALASWAEIIGLAAILAASAALFLLLRRGLRER